MKPITFKIINRVTGEMRDTIIATKVRDDGRYYDFFYNKLFVGKVSKKNNYYLEV